MSVFQFGGEFLKDTPIYAKLKMKDGTTQGFTMDDDHGVVFNPGEPFVYVAVFYPPNQLSENVTTTGKRNIRILTVVPWDLIAQVDFDYLPINKTDPEKFISIERPAAAGPVTSH